MKRWKSFDFGPETPSAAKKSLVKKRSFKDENLKDPLFDKGNNGKSNGTEKQNTKQLLNVYKIIAPKDVSDLAVHPKKIQEIESWLKFHVTDAPVGKSKERPTPFLLITGPTGSAKTTTLKVLCKNLNISIREWVNPVDIDYELVQGPNQVNKFLEFAIESRYSSLFETASCKKVVMVKDFPNVFMRRPEEFNRVLEECYYKNMQPIIFICTDASSREINLLRTLFPDEIQIKYGFTHYSFNPCASSLLKNALKRAQTIVQGHPDVFRSPSASNIEAILASSMGDIRCAMNQFYLASLMGGGDLPTELISNEKPSGKRKRNEKSGISAVKSMVRDETLGIFHGLGRVLNPKRAAHKNSWRLNCDVAKLVDEFSTQPSLFVSFLIENYLKYFGDINDVSNASDILSISTRMAGNWENHDSLVLGLWIAVLGLMVSNEHRVSKWNQIRGPRRLDLSMVKKEPGHTVTDMFYHDIIKKSDKSHRFKID